MDLLSAVYRSADIVRSRTVSGVVRTAVLDVPVPPAPILADWQRDAVEQLGLDAGDIEPLSLGRTRRRWPPLRHCFEAVRQWLADNAVADAMSGADVALMASRGTHYHHDGELYGGKAFCNLVLSDERDTDLHLPAAGQRIALALGTVLLFDPCQPHAIIRRGAPGFDAADFASAHRPPQVFLTWELPIEHPPLAANLGVRVDVALPPAALLQADQVWRNGMPVALCPATGAWLPAMLR